MEVVPTITKNGPSSVKDYANNIRQEESTFNRFVKPREGAIWNEHSSAIQRLHAGHDSIMAVDDMDVVWEEFIGWFGTNMNREDVRFLIAYNGETCDLKWLWKLT